MIESSERALFILYKNYKGKIGVRHVEPIDWFWGSSQYHLKPQWLLKAFDFDKQEERTFAVQDIRGIWIQND